jgi:hypothetical protein
LSISARPVFRRSPELPFSSAIENSCSCERTQTCQGEQSILLVQEDFCAPDSGEARSSSGGEDHSVLSVH